MVMGTTLAGIQIHPDPALGLTRHDRCGSCTGIPFPHGGASAQWESASSAPKPAHLFGGHASQQISQARANTVGLRRRCLEAPRTQSAVVDQAASSALRMNGGRRRKRGMTYRGASPLASACPHGQPTDHAYRRRAPLQQPEYAPTLFASPGRPRQNTESIPGSDRPRFVPQSNSP